MGSTTYSSHDWNAYATKTASKTVDEIYTAKAMDPKNDPKNIVVRESRDSDAHPETFPVLIAVDGSGSMGDLSLAVARKVGLVFEELLKLHEAGSIPYPQVAVSLFRDVAADYNDWFQFSQFESDTKTLMEQVEKFSSIGTGGGGNNSESEGLVWFTASTKVVHDHSAKRGKKGFLFTIGDEEVPPDLQERDVRKVFGEAPEKVPTNEELLKALAPEWEVFHLMVQEGWHMQRYGEAVVNSWTKLLGERALLLTHTDAMLEVITSTIRILGGESRASVTGSYTGDTALAVQAATRNLKVSSAGTSAGIVRL